MLCAFCGFCGRLSLRGIDCSGIRGACLSLVHRGEEHVEVRLAVLVQIDMGKCAIDNDGIDEEFVIGQVGLANADGDVFGTELASAFFGEVHLVKLDLALDVRRKDAVQVAADGDVCREETGEVLIADVVVQVGLDAGECKAVQVQVNVEIVSRHVGIDLHVQVAAVCKLEAHIHAGCVIFEINSRNVDGKVLEVELGTHLGILINNVAFLKDDVTEAELDREPGCDFCSALACTVLDLLFVRMLGVIEAVFCSEVLQNAGEVESLTMLLDAHVKRLHVDVANVERPRKELHRVDVDAELLECDKGRLVVRFHDRERVYVQDVGERVQADVLDGDASANHFLGVLFDVATGNLGRYEKCDEVEEDQRS